MQRRKVDLPEPDGPRTTTFSPWLSEKSMPFKTLLSPKVLRRFLMRSISGMIYPLMSLFLKRFSSRPTRNVMR